MEEVVDVYQDCDIWYAEDDGSGHVWFTHDESGYQSDLYAAASKEDAIAFGRELVDKYRPR
jgi:hypothetical protein